MTVSGLTVGPSKCFLIPARGANSLSVDFPALISISRPKGKFRSLHGRSRHQALLIRSAMDASYSDPTGIKCLIFCQQKVNSWMSFLLSCSRAIGVLRCYFDRSKIVRNTILEKLVKAGDYC